MIEMVGKRYPWLMNNVVHGGDVIYCWRGISFDLGEDHNIECYILEVSLCACRGKKNVMLNSDAANITFDRRAGTGYTKKQKFGRSVLWTISCPNTL